MRTVDLGWFGLRVLPFSKEIAEHDLWLPSSKTELVDDLADAIESRGTVLLTGEPGVGKTCVLRALRRRLSPDAFRLTYCHNATLGRRDFYRQLCLALGLAPSATALAYSTPSARMSRSSAATASTLFSYWTKRICFIRMYSTICTSS
jgi:type II secretory pathway predicted ATPase ExeA